ncbi:unnamed protein product (macronuclear) [Paramecium tetraurelia]|uniref:Uncharacterized protein n=1 Tax=Paramecium tetraurelia TaxID=5888 RepID=A0CJ21_PARTE|nr:uncharacterized protein GSPATT00007923001 [Paramecium tetraurelia]CAK70788.1 unnamed protein product [Paramecium tetraurelia]|eukprot:XP_001438185.1 hypothetical protein (macronuclear) [Paramecium tetraurelia strain d4-2]
MYGNKNKNAALISIYCQRYKMRLNSTPHVIANQLSINNLSGQRVQTDSAQIRRIKTMRSQRSKLYYKSESREPIKFSNSSKFSSIDSRKHSNYDSHVNTSTSDNEDKALTISKMIFSVKSPLQSLRFQGFTLDKKPSNIEMNRRKTLRNSLFANSYKNQHFLMTGNECGWSRKSSESLIYLC